jgi:hypothetical protein
MNSKAWLLFLLNEEFDIETNYETNNDTDQLGDFFSFFQSALFLDSTRKCSILRGLPQNNIPEHIETLSDDEMRRCYRFTLNEIGQIYSELRIPDVIRADNRSCISGIKALLMLLRKMAFPIRIQCLGKLFNIEFSQISRFLSCIVRIIFNRFSRIMLFDRKRLTLGKLEEYAACFRTCGIPYHRLWGFIDGTIKKICRPLENQRLYYSGHKRMHCLRFQNVTTPDGLISSFFGPLPGSHNDLNILDESGLTRVMDEFCGQYYLYGDSAYVSRGPRFMTAFTPATSEEEKKINVLMNSFRTEVEHSFAVVSNNFSFTNLSRMQKLNLGNTIREYTISVLFCNILNCFRPNQVSQRFDMNPPSITEYLNS